ncbi:MAG TPA: hypothetical protein ENN67_05435 [Firmicutes bacterium]|nr:hypothetical protein [Bacillota bacterium]
MDIRSLIRVPILLVGFMLTFIFLSIAPLHADGFVIGKSPKMKGFDYIDETQQNAYINYSDGLQRMILTIGIASAETDRVWILPIPSAPQDIVLDILREVPEFSGDELSRNTASKLHGIRKALLAMQIYPMLFRFKEDYQYREYGYAQGIATKSNVLEDSTVIVHQHVEKEGMVSEVLTARNAEALYNYLEILGFKINTGAIPILDTYIGKEFSFVVSWVEKSEINRTAYTEKGVFVIFPTPTIYYPLIPTSVYDETWVPTTITVIGHVTPRFYGRIKGFAFAEYFVWGSIWSATDLSVFHNGENKRVNYTKIEIDSPSKYLTEDLYIDNVTPLKVRLSLFILSYPFISGLILLCLTSVSIGLILGFLLLEGLRRKPWALIIIGLSNCFTIIGLIAATYLFQTAKVTDNTVPIIKQLRETGYLKRKRYAEYLFIYGITVIFFGIFVGITDKVFTGYHPLEIFLFFVLPAFALAQVPWLLKINEKDKQLISEIKQKEGKAAVAFNIYGVEKITFIISFSLIYVITSWELIEVLIPYLVYTYHP